MTKTAHDRDLARDIAIIVSAADGKSGEEIGAALGISRERVRQILDRYAFSTMAKCAMPDCRSTIPRSGRVCEECRGHVVRGRKRAEPVKCWVCGRPALQNKLCQRHYSRARYMLDPVYREEQKARNEAGRIRRQAAQRATMDKANRKSPETIREVEETRT